MGHFPLKFGENQRKLSDQYQLSTLRHDGGSVTVATVSLVLALCLMIDLHGHVTEGYEAISNGRCNLGPKHCFIMMSPHTVASIYTATPGTG